MQYGFTLDIDTGDLCALDNAVRPYLDHCRKEIAAGNTYSFAHDLERLERMMERLIATERIIADWFAIRAETRSTSPKILTRQGKDGSKA